MKARAKAGQELPRVEMVMKMGSVMRFQSAEEERLSEVLAYVVGPDGLRGDLLRVLLGLMRGWDGVAIDARSHTCS